MRAVFWFGLCVLAGLLFLLFRSMTHRKKKGKKLQALNNPLAIKQNPLNKRPWKGQRGVDDRGFIEFDSPYYGMRAGLANLVSYHKKGLDTIQEIIPVYAPDSENDTAAYINSLSRITGLEPGRQIEIKDLKKLARGIEKIENGYTWVSDSDLQNAFEEVVRMLDQEKL